MADWKQTYLESAAAQIRWKRARNPLMRELEDHLESELDANLAAGMEPEAAQREALRQMGDAVLVGQELDRVHRPKPQWGLLCLTVLIAIAGAVVRMTIARGSTVGEPERVLFYLLLGFAALLGCYFLDCSFFARHAVVLYCAAVLLGIFSLIFSPQYAGTSYYSRYFVVMIYPVIYAALVSRLCVKGWFGLLTCLALLIPLGLICLAAPSLLGLLVLLISAAAILSRGIWCGWFRISRGKAFGLLGALGLIGIGAVIFTARPALSRRLLIATQPALDAQGYGFQAMQITDALQHARLWGPVPAAADGLRTTVCLIPCWDTDALLTCMICRIGWIPFGILCLGLFGLLLWCAIRILRQRGILSQLMGLGILLTLGLQMLCSLAMNLGFVLLGATCPFLMGNLHSVLDLALMGLLLSALRQENLPEARIIPHGTTPRISLRSGELVIRFR